MNYKKISTVGTVRGLYDLIVVFWVDDAAEFYDFWKKTLVKYGNYFAERFFSLYIQGNGYPSSFLLYDKSDTVEDVKVDRFGITSRVKIDEIDYMLLNEIALNARISLVELADKIGCSSQNVIYRINKLQKSGLIQSFRISINFSELGYQEYKVNIFLKNHEKRMNIVKYLEKTPFIRYFSASLGLCDLEFQFIVRDADHMTDIIESINDEFPDSIRNYNYYSDIIAYKETFLPEMTETDFKKK